jgi:FHA domain
MLASKLVTDPERPQDTLQTLDQLPKGSRPIAQLKVLSGPAKGECLLVPDAMVLGRLTEGPACFDAEGVSREHARVWRSAKGAFHLEDLGSKNGTFVNEMPIKRRTLIIGDHVRLGPDLVLEFTITYDAQTPSGPLDAGS